MNKQVIVFDKEFARGHPDNAFYLRIEGPGYEITTVDLEGVRTMPAARAKAREMGYEPTHHMTYVMGGPNFEWSY